MFKSVFAKYVTAFMTIITFGFAVLLLVMTAIVSRYSVQVKTELLDHVAQIIEESVSSESREVLSLSNSTSTLGFVVLPGSAT